MWAFYAKYSSVMSKKPLYTIIASSNTTNGSMKLLNFHRQPTLCSFLRHCCSSSRPPLQSSAPAQSVTGTFCCDNLFKKCKELFPLSYSLSKRQFSHIPINQNKTKVQRSKPKPKLEIQKNRSADEVFNRLNFNPKDWNTIYRFSYIRAARVIQKMKIYQTVLTCCLTLPGSLGCYLYGAVPPEAVGFFLVTSVIACGMLYIMGRFCSRLVGIIYTSTTDDTSVRIAHLNFWGQREDQIFSKTDFIPFSELPDNVSDIYVNTRFYSEPDTKFHLCVRYGSIFDKKQFEDIFGTHSKLAIIEKSITQSNREENGK